LDERLEDEGGDLVRTPDKLFFEARERVGAVDGAGWRRDGDALDEERTEHAMEEVDAADANRAERVTVIGLAQAEEALLLRLAAECPVLERLLEGDLDRGGAGVRVEDAAKISGGDLEQIGGELDSGFV
jgi:hypothetical protein